MRKRVSSRAGGSRGGAANRNGAVLGAVELDLSGSATSRTPALMHQVVVAQLAAARSGTQSTKTRAEVAGGGAKPFRQKGMGRSRQGSIRAPHWVGGGVALGPKPRSYRQRTPKKMIRLALRSALSDRARLERVVLVNDWAFEMPKTKQAVAALSALGPRAVVFSSCSDQTTWSPSARSETCSGSRACRSRSSTPTTSYETTGSCSPTSPCPAGWVTSRLTGAPRMRTLHCTVPELRNPRSRRREDRQGTEEAERTTESEHRNAVTDRCEAESTTTTPRPSPSEPTLNADTTQTGRRRRPPKPDATTRIGEDEP